MNKYYLVTIQIMKDGTNPVAIFAYDSEKEATIAYHNTCASNRSNENIVEAITQILDNIGSKVIKDVYTVSVVEPEE